LYLICVPHLGTKQRTFQLLWRTRLQWANKYIVYLDQICVLYYRNFQGRIIALDKTRDRVERLKNQCIKMGANNVSCFVWDSTKCVSLEESKKEDNSPPFPENYFDRILLDAPCSSLGKRPQLRNNISPKQLHSYPPLQKKLLENVSKLCKIASFI
jgi:16S rRNA C967 or C1407 C5-methylase (RsmB/RsmF family)